MSIAHLHQKNRNFSCYLFQELTSVLLVVEMIKTQGSRANSVRPSVAQKAKHNFTKVPHECLGKGTKVVFKIWHYSDERLTKWTIRVSLKLWRNAPLIRDLGNLWNRWENLCLRHLSAILCCIWPAEWIPWLLRLRHQLLRVGNV